MRLSRGTVALAAGTVLLLAVPTYATVESQRDARDDLEQRFEERVEAASGFAAGALESALVNQLQFADDSLSGPSVEARTLREWIAGGSPPTREVVLDSRGRVLAGYPAAAARERRIARLPEVRRALAGEPTFGEIRMLGDAPEIVIAVPYDTPRGRRVSVSLMPPKLLDDAFKNLILKRMLEAENATAHVLDGGGRLVSGPDGATLGRAVTGSGLLEAAIKQGTGTFDGRRFVARRITGSSWRIVVATPTRDLYAPLSSGRRLAWLLLAGFAAAFAGWVIVMVRVHRRTRELQLSKEREQANAKLAYERLHDPLTGLPNRALLRDRLETALARQDEDRAAALLVLSVDRLSVLNDGLGHAAGDALLLSMARRISSVVRPGDTVARFSGSEFAVLLDPLDAVEQALAFADRIAAAAGEAFAFNGHQLTATLRAGIAPVRRGELDADEMIRGAHAALHLARETGASYEVVDEELRARASTRVALESDLRGAIDRDQLRLAYQPVVCMDDGRTVAVEALLRWQRPGHGPVSPAEFIPVAEDTGLILPIGAWVLGEACRQTAAWRYTLEGHADLCVSVNVSACQLLSDDLEPSVRAALASSGLPPSALTLEVTETSMISELDRALEALTRLKALGVRLALDDFGVGYSSLAHIARLLPVDELKIDRSFVAAIDTPREAAVVTAVLELGRSLELDVVAEGVETNAQLEAVRSRGGGLVQGFLFSRPVLPADLPGAIAGAQFASTHPELAQA